MEAFVGEPPPAGVDPIDHYFTWDEERLKTVEPPPATAAIAQWVRDFEPELERFGGAERVLQDSCPLSRTVEGSGAYLILDRTIGTDQIEELMDLIKASALQHGLMFVDSLAGEATVPQTQSSPQPSRPDEG